MTLKVRSFVYFGLPAIAAAVVLLLPFRARAIPRFAARTGMACIQCHINPSGGGMRNEYGRNVFERSMLPMGRFDRRWLSADDEPAAPPASAESPSGGAAADADEPEAPTNPLVNFTGDITDWLAIGADFRTAYIHVRPDRGFAPGTEPNVTNSFFLMQSDLYIGATLNDNLRFVIDLGVYSGFEGWGLFNLTGDPKLELYVKVGRFMPTFGIREVEHQLFTREGIGLGTSDRDTGVEATLMVGPLTANLAVTNGTLGDTPFDTHGGDRREFEKAITSRLAASMHFAGIRLQLGASASWNQDVSQANPMFGSSLPEALVGETSKGLDEVRLGGFATANVGRFTWLGDLVWARDAFYSDELAPISGYASYQELSFVAMRGLDLVATFEFMDPDVEVVDNRLLRAGFVAEIFPWPYVEFRAMVRRFWADQSATGGAWDVVLFAHLFM